MSSLFCKYKGERENQLIFTLGISKKKLIGVKL